MKKKRQSTRTTEAMKREFRNERASLYFLSLQIQGGAYDNDGGALDRFITRRMSEVAAGVSGPTGAKRALPEFAKRAWLLPEELDKSTSGR